MATRRKPRTKSRRAKGPALHRQGAPTPPGGGLNTGPGATGKGVARERAPSAEEIWKKSGYAAFERQQEFHNSAAKYRLFGGAAGPGKTKALLFEAIRQAHLHGDKHPVDTLLLRRTFPELESSLVAYFRRDLPRDLYASYNESKHIVTWLNGSTTRFGHCAHENDIYQYQGAEYLFIGIDELTHFTLKMWQFLTSRNRCPVAGSVPNMAGATNPGNIGHAWVKALWIDQRAPAGMDRPDQYDPADYAFIRATVADNPIYADDREYRRTLEALPTHLRRAFLDGEWDVFAGQYFDMFDRARHTPRAEELQLEPWWRRRVRGAEFAQRRAHLARSRHRRRARARSRARLRGVRAGILLDSLGHSLRTGLSRTLRRAAIHGREDLRHGNLRACIFLGTDASDGTGRARTRLRRRITGRAVRSRRGTRIRLPRAHREARAGGRQCRARPAALERRRQHPLRPGSASAPGALREALSSLGSGLLFPAPLYFPACHSEARFVRRRICVDASPCRFNRVSASPVWRRSLDLRPFRGVPRGCAKV